MGGHDGLKTTSSVEMFEMSISSLYRIDDYYITVGIA